MATVLPNNFPDLPTLNALNLGALLGIGDERVRQLAKQGVIIQQARGQFDLRQSVLNYINYVREAKTNQHDRPKTPDGPADYEEERARLTRAKASRAEIELDVIRGRVHEGEAVLSVWNDNLMACRSKLLTIPTKAAPIVAGMEPADALLSLTDFVHEALDELADYDPQSITDRTDKKRLFGEASPGHDVAEKPSPETNEDE